MVGQVCNSITLETEAGELQVQGQPRHHDKQKTTL